MKITVNAAQRQGCRKEQQDVYGSDRGENKFATNHIACAMADGMGGMAMGRECADVAVSTFLKVYSQKAREESFPDILEKSAVMANKSVYALASQYGVEENAGCTLIAVAIDNDMLYWISVGDSHIYVLKSGSAELLQINKEHNLRNRLDSLAEKGIIKRDEIDDTVNLDALTSYIGIKKLVDIDFNRQPVTLNYGDKILLCSDGLYKTLSKGEICELMLSKKINKAEKLVNMTIAKKNAIRTM